MDQRKNLLEAAITCLQERGYARTTTRDIVAAAGSHLPAVNYYFGSKERLLGEAITEGLRRWMETTMSAARDPAPAAPGERLRHSVETFLATLERDRPYVVAAFEAFAQANRSDALRDRLAGEYRYARRQVADSVADVAADQDIRLDETQAAEVASALLAVFDGLAIQWLLAPRDTPSADQVMRALALLAAAATDAKDAPGNRDAHPGESRASLRSCDA